MNTLDEKLAAFRRLLEIMDELREKCPWDQKQTNDTLRNLTIEETYELADAILEKNDDEIKNELGDLLLHIVFYARIGSEKRQFDMADIINGLNEKLIYRHPHVFGDVHVNDYLVGKQTWQAQLMRVVRTVLGGVPGSLPAMIKSNRIQEKVKAVGFDWEEKDQIWDKVSEEFSELQEEVKNGDPGKIESEFGDLLFSVINAARLYGIDPETALEKTNKKFIKRFNYLEKNTLSKGQLLKDMSLDEMNEIWEQAKNYD